DGWTQARAQDALQDELAKVQLGTWTPPEPEPAPVVEQDPTFHVFATDWLAAHEREWRPKTSKDYEWKLSDHLLPFFQHHRLSQITIAEVDRYRAAKLKQGTLSPTSINKTIALLAQVLEDAVEYGQIDRNPARGRRRRLKADKPAPVWLDSAEQIAALPDAAGELDREARADRQVPRRAILATLTLAGLRIGELVELRWRDVDLAAGRITVRQSKTDAGARHIDLLPALRDELATLKARAKPTSSERVFPTQAGGPLNQSNVRNRTLALSVERANERLEAAGSVPLPEGLTPHKLRHTFASLLVALGTDPGAVMDQLGHTDPAFTLRVYRHGMRRDPEARTALALLVGINPGVRPPTAGSMKVGQLHP
ncbi:MAG: tyrosine-type recombinase/integrase, partial [Solirubrobacteraceae bacterium]